ncbi:MAG TPA: hypothetical protein VMQ76_05530, partial [Terracidiphilus sp.]|nr:hypothetical protein [Terracidiphilus sp.]
EWEAKYGKPDPMWSANLVHDVVDAAVRKQAHIEEKRAVLWQAIRDSIYYTENAQARAMDLGAIVDNDERIEAFKFWRQAAKRNQRDHPTEVTAFRLELERDGWDKLMEYDWARGIWPPAALRKAISTPGPITQADVNRELRAQGRESGDGE